MPARTKFLIGLLVLVVAAAAVVIYLRRSADPRTRLAHGEWSSEDVAAFRADPSGWVNLVGSVMRERALEGDAETARALSRFMIDTLESLDPEARRLNAQPAAWMHAAALASQGVASARAAWVADIGAGDALRLRIVCAGFGPALEAPLGEVLAPAFAQTLAAGLAAQPGLEDLVTTYCSAPLQTGFQVLLERSSGQVLADYTALLMRVTGTERLPALLAQDAHSLRALDALSRGLDEALTGAEEAGDDAAMEALTAFRQNALGPAVAAALDEMPATAPELWEPVDEAGTPRVLSLLVEILDQMPPLVWYGLLDRLLASAPEDARTRLAGLHVRAETLARQTVEEVVLPALEPCRPQAGAPALELTIELERGRGPALRGNGLPGPVRACVENALGTVTVENRSALLRPLSVTVALEPAGG